MNVFEALKFAMWHFTEEFNDEEIIKEQVEEQYQNLQSDVKGIAALVTVLNHRCWYWYDNHNDKLTQIYSDLYYKYNELEWNWLEAYGTSEEKNGILILWINRRIYEYK